VLKDLKDLKDLESNLGPVLSRLTRVLPNSQGKQGAVAVYRHHQRASSSTRRERATGARRRNAACGLTRQAWKQGVGADLL
jgi:hypothetical protein